MTTRLSRLRATAIAVVVAAGVAACSSPSAAPSGSTTGGGRTSSPSTSQSAAAGAAPKPAGTESNPPGDIPDTQAYVAFSVPGKPVSVKVPEGWARNLNGDITMFTDKLNGVQVRVTASTAALSQTSVRSTEVPSLQRVVPKFTLGAITTVRRAGQPVLLLTYQGDSAPNQVTGKVVRDAFERYIFVHGGLRLDLTLFAPTNADNVDPWRLVSDSVRWTG